MRFLSGLRDTLVTRLVVAVVVTGLVGAVLGAFLVAATGRAALREDVGERHVALADELAARLDSRLEVTREILTVVAANGRLLGDPEAATAELRATLRGSERFDGLRIVRPDGAVLAAAAHRHLAVPSEMPRQTGLDAVLDGEVIQRIAVGEPPRIEMSVPVEDPPGNPVAALVAELPIDLLMHPAQHVDVRSRTVRYLVDGDGRILAHPERDRVVRAEQVPIATLLAAPNHRAVLEVGGERSLVGISPLEDLDLAVVVQQPEADAYRDVDRQVTVFGVILVLVLGSVVGVTSLVGRRILRPVAPLADAVERIDRGERGVRIHGDGSGELRRLSDRVDELAVTLDRRTSALEELQQLSLLVNARLQREEVTDDIVEGAITLLRGDTASLWLLTDEDELELEAVRPPEADVTATRTAALAVRECGEALEASDDDAHTIALPVTDGEGAILGVLVVCREQEAPTEEEVALTRVFAAFSGVALENVRRLELEQALVSQLQETNDRKQHLIGSISHEFRTPLACVVGFAEALDEGWDDYSEDDRRDFVARIATHAEEIDELVRQLLDFAVVERAAGGAELRTLELAPLVATAVGGLQPLLDGRQVTVDVPDVAVLADAAFVRRVLTNLLSNAMKYSPAGSPIEVRCRTLDGEAHVSVTDHGVGLDPDEAARVFEPFWRASNGTARGVGLGLALVSQYVAAMNGRVEVDSTPGEGSTFTFTLPLAPQPAQQPVA